MPGPHYLKSLTVRVDARIQRSDGVHCGFESVSTELETDAPGVLLEDPAVAQSIITRLLGTAGARAQLLIDDLDAEAAEDKEREPDKE